MTDFENWNVVKIKNFVLADNIGGKNVFDIDIFGEGIVKIY
ncbi:MAG: hypothetical protein AAF208_08760 [Cyanobacteria bacterium P01_A01_bin.45]